MYIESEENKIQNNDDAIELNDGGYDYDAHEEEYIDRNIKGSKYYWQAPEHEIPEKDKKWYAYAGLILAGIVAYAIITDSPIMAITFILIGAVGYMIMQKEPSIINFYIINEGIVANRTIYYFDDLESFWIFYEPDQIKVISLHSKHKLLPYMHIPIGKADPNVIRKLLLEHVREEKHEHNIVDIFERIIGV